MLWYIALMIQLEVIRMTQPLVYCSSVILCYARMRFFLSMPVATDYRILHFVTIRDLK